MILLIYNLCSDFIDLCSDKTSSLWAVMLGW